MARPSMDIEAHRDLKLLEAVDAGLARHAAQPCRRTLGIALGLTNIYLKRLVRKGYIKCVNVQSNRISYLITPRGIAEKARLTYEFMDYSLHLYGEVRQHLRAVLQECAAAGRRVAIFGRGEAAELAYLSLKEFGLEPVAIFDVESGGPSSSVCRCCRSAEHRDVDLRPDDRRHPRRDRGSTVAASSRTACRRKNCFRFARKRSTRRRPAPELVRVGQRS